MAGVTICSDFRVQEEEICHWFHLFPLYLPWSDGTRCHDLRFFVLFCFLILNFKPAFSLSSFTLIKRLFSSSSSSAIRVVSSTIWGFQYFSLQSWFQLVLHVVCSLAFHMIYSAYKLNKLGDNTQPWCTISQFWTSPLFHVQFYCFLTCIQVSQETDKIAWYFYLSKSFPQFVMIHTVKGFSIVNEAEIGVFLQFPCFLYDPTNVSDLISGSFAYMSDNSKSEVCEVCFLFSLFLFYNS